MKNFIVAIAAVLMLGTNAVAQDNPGRERRQITQEERVRRQTDRMSERFGLNEEQKSALLKVNTAYFGKLRGVFGPRGGRNFHRGEGDRHERPTEEQRQALRKQMEENMAAYNAELKKILTEEQYSRYEEQRRRMHLRGGMRGQRRDGRRDDSRQRDSE